MQGFLKLSTAKDITVLMIDSADHITGKTGLSAGLTIYATKAGGTPAAITPTVTELDSTNVKGLYKLAFTSSHTDTLGELQIHVTATGADPTDVVWQVSTYVPGEAATLQADQAVNATKLAGQTITAAAGVTFPTLVASPTNITAGTITTVTNLTNAATAGDLTAAMIASVTTAATAATPTAAAVTGAVGSVTGNVGGNVVGSVASVTADVGITQTGADKVWASATRTLTSLGTVVADTATAVWGAATRILTAGTNIALAKGTGVTGFNDLDAAGVRTAVGLASANLDAQLAAIAGYGDTEISAIKAVTDKLNDTLQQDGGSPLRYQFTAGALELAPSGGSAPSAATIADAVWDEARAGHVAGGSFGEGIASVQGNVTGTVATVTAVTGLTASDVGAIKAKTDNLPAAPSAVGDIPTAAQNADKFLGRTLAGGADGGRTVKDALRSLRNKTSITAGTLTVTEEDDTTPAWTATVTTAPGDPLTSIDPA